MRYPIDLILSIYLKDSFYFSAHSSLPYYTVIWDICQGKKNPIALVFLAYAFFSL